MPLQRQALACRLHHHAHDDRAAVDQKPIVGVAAAFYRRHAIQDFNIPLFELIFDGLGDTMHVWSRAAGAEYKCLADGTAEQMRNIIGGDIHRTLGPHPAGDVFGAEFGGACAREDAVVRR